MRYKSLRVILAAVTFNFVTVNAGNWRARKAQESDTETCSPLGERCSEDCECCGYDSGEGLSSVGCRVKERFLGMRCYECGLEGSTCLISSDCCVGTCSEDRTCVNPCVESKISHSSVSAVIGDIYNDVGTCPCKDLEADKITNDPLNAVDGSKDTDYVNNNAIGSGLVLGAAGSVDALSVCTNTDCVECDPTCYKVEGLMDGASEFGFVQSGALDLSMERGECTVVRLVGLPSYMKYKVTFPCIRGGFGSCGADASTELVAPPCSEFDKGLRNVLHFEHSSYANGVTNFIYGYFMPFYHMVLPYVGECKFKPYQVKRGEGNNTLMKTDTVEDFQDSRDPDLCMRGIRLTNFYPDGTMVADQKTRFYFLVRIEGAVRNSTSLHGIYGGNGERGYHKIGVPDCSTPVDVAVTEMCTKGKDEIDSQAIYWATRKYQNGYTYIGYEFYTRFTHATISMLGSCITKNNNYHVMKRTGNQKGEIMKTKPMKRFVDTREPKLCMGGAKVSTYWNGQNLQTNDYDWHSFRFDLEGDVPLTQGTVGVLKGNKISYYELPVPDCSDINYPAEQPSCSSSYYSGWIAVAGFGYNQGTGYTYFAYEFPSTFEKVVMEMFGECEFKNDSYELFKKTGGAGVGTQMKKAKFEKLTYERDPDLCMSGLKMTTLDDEGNVIPDGNTMHWLKFAVKGNVPRKYGKIAFGGNGKRQVTSLLIPDCSGVTSFDEAPSTCENYPMKVSEVNLIGKCESEQSETIVPTNVYALKSSTNGFYLNVRGKMEQSARPDSKSSLNWQLINVGKDDVGDKFAIKNVQDGNYLDGRNPEHVGDELLLTDRDPLNDMTQHLFKGSEYLWWYLVDVGNGKIAIKSFTSGNYLDGRYANSESRTDAHLTSSNNPSNDANLHWTLEYVREWDDMEWFSSASLRPSQRFALKSLSSQNYLYDRECSRNYDVNNDAYTESGPPDNDPGYEFQITKSDDGYAFTTRFDLRPGGCHLDGRHPGVTPGPELKFAGKSLQDLRFYFTWYPINLGSNRFALKSHSSGLLLNGRNAQDAGLNGAWLDGSGDDPATNSHLQWHLVYLYG